MNGVTALGYWLTWRIIEGAQSIVFLSVLKFIFYVDLMLWLNSVFALYKGGTGAELDSFEFQKDQVKFTLWVLGILVWMEIPIWLDALSA